MSKLYKARYEFFLPRVVDNIDHMKFLNVFFFNVLPCAHILLNSSEVYIYSLS